MASLIQANGRPTKAALALAEHLEHALDETQDELIRLHLKRSGASGRAVNPGVHNTTVRMLLGARVKFFEGNDSPDGDRMGDYIGLLRSAARDVLARINSARN